MVSAQWIGSALGVGSMILTKGRFSARLALLLMAAGAALMAAHFGWGLMLMASVLFGTGYGIAASTFNPRVMTAFSERGPAMVSLLNATFAAGAILAPLLFVWAGSDPRIAFAAVAVFCALSALTAGPVSRSAVAQGAQQGAAYRFRPLVLAFSLAGVATEACLIGLGPTALIRTGLDATTAAQLLSAFFVAFLLARILLVFVLTLIPSFLVFAAAAGLAAVCSFLAAVLPAGPFFVLMGISAGAFFPSIFVTATRQMGDHPNVAPSIIAAGLLGGIASPVVMGAVMAGTGPHGFFWLLGGTSAAITLAALALYRRMA